MNQVIKDRIDRIKRGEVPEGYKAVKNIGIVPIEWPVGFLGKVLQQKMRSVPKPASAYWRLGLRSYAKGTFHELVQDPETIGMEKLYVVKENDLIVNITFAWEHAVAIASKEDEGKLVSHRFPTYVFRNGNSPQFFKYIVMQKWFRQLLDSISPGGAGRNRVMSKTAFLKLPCYTPPLAEQEKIAEIISTWDKAILLMEKLIDEKKKQKKWLMQNLLNPDSGMRLSGFEGAWVERSFRDLFEKVSVKNNQINSSEYFSNGIYPVVDQGQKKIVAYSNNKNKVFRCPQNGVIIFGDHTCEIKYVNFDFIVGADGTQVLKVKGNNNTYFLYNCLLNNPIRSTGYNRHFKYLKKVKIMIPQFDEQTAIANIFCTADKEIDLLEQKLEQLQMQKKALMQLLLTGIVRVTI